MQGAPEMIRILRPNHTRNPRCCQNEINHFRYLLSFSVLTIRKAESVDAEKQHR